MTTIKLTVHSGNAFQSYSFDKETIMIGRNLSNSVDLPLLELNDQNCFIEIAFQKDQFFVINITNDPFILLNGLPFGKKRIQEGDTLTFGPYSLLVEQLLSEPEFILPPVPLNVNDATDIDQALVDSSQAIESFMVDVGEEPEQIFHQAISPASYEAKYLKISLKDDVFTEADQDSYKSLGSTPKDIRASISESLKRWKWIFWVLIVCMMISSLVAVELYLRLNGERELEELQAAKGISDVAMALTYAQLHHASAGKQNWSDPDFIENNLMAVVSSPNATVKEIFGNGHSAGTPFTLRIFISNDLSRFLLVAQPSPTLWQWLVPKNAILVDSTNMYLRRTTDFKVLNRLLASPNPLEGNSSVELADLLMQSQLITLSQIALATDDTSFALPKALKVMRPGAENLIYNSPRYHEFGENFLNQAMALSDIAELASGKEELPSEGAKMSKFKDLVLYVPLGKKMSPKIERILSQLSPEGGFMLGYLKYDFQGRIKSSHLMLDSDHVWSRNAIAEKEDDHQVTVEDTVISEPIQMPPPEDNASQRFIQNKMQELAMKRQAVLKPLAEELRNKLEKYQTKGSSEQLSYLIHLFFNYQTQAKMQDDLVINELALIRAQNPDITAQDFQKYAHEAGIESFLNSKNGTADERK